ncbi:MAG TPA: hypothetical protein VJK03_01685 [Candidatus Nanoarchaeia archaeon]|nr:hypothetical protein [Candidatus Nanoarchaeia archaeon]
MELENLLEAVAFEGIVPGSYSGEHASLMPFLEDTRSGEEPEIKSLVHHDLDGQEHEVRGSEPVKYRSSYSRARGSFSLSMPKTAMERHKPADVLALEEFLRKAYKAPQLVVTKVESVPITRKDVRRVFFALRNQLYQVWAFKADPATTARELTASTIAWNHGIPTGKPLGFNLARHARSYPYDTALLGGILEHAGDSYDSLLDNLSYAPGLMFGTAHSVAHMLAQFHVNLTEAREEFSSYGVVLQRASPRREIEKRMLPVLGIDSSNQNAEQFIRACENLYDRQRGDLVVSHGDIHTGNIVTLMSIDAVRHQPKTSLHKFGIIDFESISLDYPQGDLADFWLHHQRKALEVFPDYNYSFEKFSESYFQKLGQLARNHDVVSTSFYRASHAPIQKALWNVYELFDPTRTQKDEIMKKAQFHYRALCETMGDLQEHGLSRDRRDVLQALHSLLKKTHYKRIL